MLELTQKDAREMACRNSAEYIRTICDFVAVPVIRSAGIAIFLYRADAFAARLIPDNRYFITRPHELYARVSRRINEAFTRQCLGAPARIIDVRTVEHFDDMPKHRNTLAGGFEILLTVESGGVHIGDDIHKADVLHPIFGNIECKYKDGRVISQAQVQGGD